jgi:hypothetical protein
MNSAAQRAHNKLNREIIAQEKTCNAAWSKCRAFQGESEELEAVYLAENAKWETMKDAISDLVRVAALMGNHVKSHLTGCQISRSLASANVD